MLNGITKSDVLTNINLKFESIENNYASAVLSGYENIWKLNADKSNIYIAYESMDNINAKTDIDDTTIRDIILAKGNTYYIGVVRYECRLNTVLIDETFNIYKTSFETISNLSITSDIVKISKNDDNKYSNEDCAIINSSYPKCNLFDDNRMQIDMLVTSLGGTKSLFNDDYIISSYLRLPEPQYSLLSATIAETPSAAIEGLKNTILSGNFYSKILEKQVYLSAGYEELYNQITGNLLSVPTDNKPGVFDNWKFDFSKENINKTMENNSTISINDINSSIISGMQSIIEFTPSITNCLVDPMKLIFNFGETIYSNVISFDMDVNVSIDDEKEFRNTVGWHCGLKQTRYLDWITGDNTSGGPEIVTVDLDTYKQLNPKEQTVDILVNACWFVETQIESINPTLDIIWKGISYTVPIIDMHFNNSCCSNLILKITVDLINNNIELIPVKYVPCVTVYSTPSNSDFNVSYGYIKVTDELESMNYSYIKCNGSNSNKQYYLLNKYYTSVNELLTDMNDYDINTLISIGKPIYFTDTFDMKWDDRIETKDNKGKTIKCTVYNYLQQVGIKLDE